MWDRFIQLSCVICLAISTWAFVKTTQTVHQAEDPFKIEVDTSKCRPMTEEEFKRVFPEQDSTKQDKVA